MHTRHHIFNFHIGFWGALLISAVITIQSGLFLLMTSGAILAQTIAPIAITEPASSIQVLIADDVPLQAVLAQPTFNALRFIITNTTTGQSEQKTAQSPDGGLTWEHDWRASALGTYSIAASVVSNQGQVLNTTANPIITVINGPTHTIISPDNGEIISGLKPFTVRTDIPVDELRFDLRPQGATSPQPLPASPTDTTNKRFNHDFDPSQFQDGPYTLQPVAILGGVEFPGPILDITVQNPIAATFTLVEPANSATIVGPLDLVGVSNEVASSASFQITNSANVILANIQATTTDGVTWTATYDTTQIPNNTAANPYALNGVATIGGVSIPTSSNSLFINNPATTLPPTITTTVLPNGVVGTQYAGAIVAIQGTPPYSYALQSGVLPGGIALDTQTGSIEGIPSDAGSFSITITVTDAAGELTAQDYQITIAAAPVTVPALSISSFTIANTVVGIPTTWRLVGSGGTPPYDWSIVSGSLPSKMSSSTSQGDLVISGTPDEAGSVTFTVQLEDADGNQAQQTFSPNVAAPAVVAPITDSTQQNTNQDSNADDSDDEAQTIATLQIQEPTRTQTISGNSVPVRFESSKAVNPVKVSLINTAGQNVLQGNTDVASAPFGDSTKTKWILTIDTTRYPNGVYTLRGDTTDAATRQIVTSNIITVTIRNGEAVQAFSGSITAPRPGQTVAGNVPLVAEINGEIQSLMFILTLPDGSTRQEAGIPNDDGDFEATWNSAGVPGGTVTIKAQVIDEQGVTKGLNTVAVTVRELRTSANDSQPEQIVDPRLVTDLQAGVSPSVPVDCQLEAITNPSECTRFLDARRIDILNEREEEILREEQLPQVVTRHIDLSEGKVTQKQEGKTIEDPLAGIIPVDKQKTKDRSVLVLSSTEPPAALKPFIQQTVPAVIIFDQDGDGLPDEMERRFGTDPTLADTDGDGFDDGTEIKNGFNPNGAGRLVEELAPVERAILNQKPLDQPRFAGAIDPENLEVAEVKSDTGTENLQLTGKAEPNSVVTLYIYSQLPIVVTTKTDAAGNWTYEMEDPLVDGKHEVYVAVTNEAGRIERKSQPLSFFVDSALAVSEEEFLANVTVEDSTSRFLLWYLLGGFMAISLGGFLFFFFFKNRVTIPE